MEQCNISLKKFQTMHPYIENWIDTLRFYRVNPRKIPGIRHFRCLINRHDWEMFPANENESAQLKCFYCLAPKRDDV